MVALMISVVALTGTAALVLYALRSRFAVAEVVGDSMLPTLRSGERLLVRRVDYSKLRVGMIVVLRLPTDPLPADQGLFEPPIDADPWVVKRIAALAGDPVPDSMRSIAFGSESVPDRTLLVSADNPVGNDSRQWGFIDSDCLLGYMERAFA